MKGTNIAASVLKILVGALFVVSALSKLVTIDTFEMYVYSFGLFPMVACFYLARLLVAAELLLGVALVSHRNHRFTTLTSLFFLIFFIVFLVYAQLIGRTDSCHCFGDMLPFNPVQSILKNAVLIAILLFVFKYSRIDWHPKWWLALIIYIIVAVLFFFYSVKLLHYLDFYSLVMMGIVLLMGLLASLPFYSKWYVTTILILAPFVATFILSPPDSWFYGEGEGRFDSELFSNQLANTETVADDTPADDTVAGMKGSLSMFGLDEGRHLVAFFSPSCGYCRLTAEKIAVIVSRFDLPSDRILYVFPDVGPDEEKYNSFYEKAMSPKFEEARIDKDLFIRITRAAFPLVLLVEDGNVVATYAYRGIDEKHLGTFLASYENSK